MKQRRGGGRPYRLFQHGRRPDEANVTDVSVLTELIERDGGACVWCARELWRSDLTAEHLLPRARRGRGTAENLAIACRRCNRNRATQSVSAYVRSLRAAGHEPRMDTLLAALRRLAASPRRAHSEYGTRQLELISGLLVPALIADPGEDEVAHDQ